MPHPKRVTVKVGSNVLTRPDGKLDVTRISALVDQIAEMHRQGMEIILVSSGAVASGRSELNMRPHKRMDPVSARQLFSAVGQAKLINRYFDLFREHGIACGQVLTTKENFSTRRYYLNQRSCMKVMLENGVIPIVNENDTVSVTELMFTDNDELSGIVATMMDAEILILLSNVDGIYDGNPSDPSSHIIPEITDKTRVELSKYIQPAKSSFGRGGMLTKYSIARKVAQEGVEVIIANGKRDNILTDLLIEGKPVLCTRFLPTERPASSVKKWIAHSESFAKGEVYINRQAVQKLCSNHAVSLLPIGVTEIKGEFEKDDIVKICNPEGKQIGVGKIYCDSTKARTLIGQQMAKPLIHYDYLYLDQEVES
ncbi:MAG: glutamate 5-kinase [Porphyromonadaceae bacterium]|nr:glutamate 5-kinase [Porphyromonadaceae bacterium]